LSTYDIQGMEWLSVISPIFVAFLLTKVSGIPILDKQNLRRWGENPEFMSYFRNTASLIPYIYWWVMFGLTAVPCISFWMCSFWMFICSIYLFLCFDKQSDPVSAEVNCG